MSSPVDLKVSRSFDLLAELKETAADFAQRETQLTRDIASRRLNETRKFRGDMERLEASLAEETARTEEFYSEWESRARTIADGRRNRITRLHQAGLASLMEQARQAKDRWLGQLQMKHFSATRNLPHQLDAERANYAQFTAQFTPQLDLLSRLQKQIRQAFSGYPSFLKLYRNRSGGADENLDLSDVNGLPAQLQEHLASLEEQFEQFRKFPIPRLFSHLPPALIVTLIFALGAGLVVLLGINTTSFLAAGLAVVVLLSVLFAVHHLGASRARENAASLASALANAEATFNTCSTTVHQVHEQELQRIQGEYDQLCATLNAQWGEAGGIEKTFATQMREKIEHKAPLLLEKNERMLAPKLQAIETGRAARLAEITTTAEAQKKSLNETHEAAVSALAQEESSRWAELEAAWKDRALPIFHSISEMNDLVGKYAPPWTPSLAENWTPPIAFPPAIKFAELDLDLNHQAASRPKDARLAWPGPAQVSIPLALTFLDNGSLLFETSDSGAATVIGTLNAVILRLLLNTPPGKASFTIIDPVGLGQNFAGLMHLADFEETLINRRIWTQRDQIEERLAELSEHIEKVIQMYLRNEYSTITEYNEQAGSVAEKYHFLVVADFPANFSETAAKRLLSIATSGPRCGVFTLIHWDRRQPLPDGFSPDELRKSGISIRNDRSEWVFSGKRSTGAENALVFDLPPEPNLAIDLVNTIGENSIDANRVEVPFSQIAPAEMWTGDTTSELRVAIGRTGATKLQYLAIGKGTRQHALFAGKTGSGKSTLFHVIITNLALTCSPDQVEFYLIDFKKGVEFKCYAAHHLPHARVVAIESDREFGLSVLQRVDEELKCRGDMFRKLGVQDIAGYKRAGGTEPMPRSLLIIDEFQEFFVDDDQIAQTASLLFDRIVRQGRAFGIHVLLGSQTLGGAYTLARATLGQMVIRVALQCNEADAYLIMDDNNPAPRLLSRPGEGIYNDAAGALEGNSPFQVVWLSDEERDAELEKVSALASERGDMHPGPIVFEGNAPAAIGENHLLRNALANIPEASPPASRCWLGAPNAIKGPTEAVFRRQSGNNLLIVGQRDEAIQTMLGLSLLALAAQHPAGQARFVVFQAGQEGGGADFLAEAAGFLPHEVIRGDNYNIAEVMNDLSEELKARSAGASPANVPPVFVFIDGLQKFKKFRQDDDFDFSSDAAASPAAQLNTLLAEGSTYGIHVIVAVDTFNNVQRFLSRKAISEFGLRVVFQMSANDSASLIDSPQAGNLGLHRALLFNEHEGSLETFRPYAAPDAEWLREAAEKMGARKNEAGHAA